MNRKRHDRIVRKINQRYDTAFKQWKMNERVWLRHDNDRLIVLKELRDATNLSQSVRLDLFNQLNSMNKHNTELYEMYNTAFQKVCRIQHMMSRYLSSRAGKKFQTNFKCYKIIKK